MSDPKSSAHAEGVFEPFHIELYAEDLDRSW
jgi:hypothetical protein